MSLPPSRTTHIHVVSPGHRLVSGRIVAEPVVVLAPTHRQAVRWAQTHGFSPRDEREGRLVLIDFGGGDRLMGRHGGSYIVLHTADGYFGRSYGQWLEKMRLILAPCQMTELSDWDGALDEAIREALFQFWAASPPWSSLTGGLSE